MLIHVDLESGIGGFALAAEWAGFITICFVEIDKYCQKVLRKHWPNVPIVEDIRDVEKIKEVVANTRLLRQAEHEKQATGLEQCGKEIVANAENGKQSQFSASDIGYKRARQTQKRPIIGTGNRSGDGDTPQGIENRDGIAATIQKPTAEQPAILVTAGFPCQPFSVAGKRQGEADNRYLWPETLAVIEAIKPRWILLENVTGIINLALDTVLSDLEGAGYTHETLIVPACAVNAPHRRDRVWIVAYDSNNGLPRSRLSISKWRPKQKDIDIGGKGQNATLAKCKGQTNDCGSRTYENMDGQTMPNRDNRQNGEQDIWSIEPELGRVAHGIPNRVDRLKCLGNAIVPQVAYRILKMIAEIES